MELAEVVAALIPTRTRELKGQLELMAMKLTSAVTIVLFTLIGSALADPAVKRGKAVVEQWCRMCHLRKNDKSNPDMAPPHEQIVLLPDRDRAYFERFMQEDHFPMTTFRLFDHEKADVIAYLMHLQKVELQKQK